MTGDRFAGIVHAGKGDMILHGPVTGQLFGQDPAGGDQRTMRWGADVGILTVIDEEMQAVTAVLRSMARYETRRIGDRGPLAHEAEIHLPSGTLRLAAVQTLDRGPRAAVVAFQNLVRQYAPAVVLLVGIAGGVSSRVRVGDVVFSDQIIYYDARREAPDGPHRRGQSQIVTAALAHRLNEFFAAHGNSATAPSGDTFRILRGPVGSGDAVITDADAEVRRWLQTYHEKVLAVETEAAGAMQAFHEQLSEHDETVGWLTIRGISDAADAAKGHDDHMVAAEHAAAAMHLLLPHLVFRGGRP